MKSFQQLRLRPPANLLAKTPVVLCIRQQATKEGTAAPCHGGQTVPWRSRNRPVASCRENPPREQQRPGTLLGNQQITKRHCVPHATLRRRRKVHQNGTVNGISAWFFLQYRHQTNLMNTVGSWKSRHVTCAHPPRPECFFCGAKIASYHSYYFLVQFSTVPTPNWNLYSWSISNF